MLNAKGALQIKDQKQKYEFICTNTLKNMKLQIKNLKEHYRIGKKLDYLFLIKYDISTDVFYYHHH